jgi:hypothetical protein
MAWKEYVNQSPGGLTQSAMLTVIYAQIVAMGWTLVDNQDASSYRVYSSNGESADRLTEYVYIDFTQAASIRFYIYEYWNTTMHIGTAGGGSYQSLTTSGASATGSLWVYGNANMFFVQTKVSTTYYLVGVGHLPTRFDSTIANVTADTTGIAAGGSTTITVDSTAGFVVNNYYQIVGINSAASTLTLGTVSETNNSTYVDTTNDRINATAHGFTANQYVYYTNTGTIGGLTTTNYYYIVGVATNTFQLSLTSGGAAIDLTTVSGAGTFNFAGCNITADTIVSVSHGLSNNQSVYYYTPGTVITGLTSGSINPYYVVNAAANTFQLSLTSGGAAIDLTGIPSNMNTHYFGIVGYRYRVQVTSIGGGTLTITNASSTVPSFKGNSTKIGVTPSTFLSIVSTATTAQCTCYIGASDKAASGSSWVMATVYAVGTFARPDYRESSMYGLSPWLVYGSTGQYESIGYCDSYFLIVYSGLNLEDILGITQDDSGTASAGGANTLTDGSKSWTTNAWQNKTVVITGATGQGQIARIVSNTSTVLTVSCPQGSGGNWYTQPANGSTYVIVEEAYRVCQCGVTGGLFAVREGYA